MSVIAYSIFGGMALFGIVAGVVYLLHKKKFKYEGFIIAEVGGSNVIIHDKAHAYQTEDGYWAIVFEHQRDTIVKSPPYKFWTLFSKPGVADDLLSEGQKGYSRGQAISMLNRGVIMKQVGEGDMKPVQITGDKDLHVVDQDDLAFQVSATRDREEIKKNKWGTYAPYLVAGGTVFLSLMVLVFFVIYFNMNMGENIATVCSGASRVASQGFNATSFIPGVGA